MSETNPTGRSATTVDTDDRWFRFLYMVIFAIISYSLLWLVLFLALVQFILAWINGQPNDNLRDFVAKLDGYFRDCLDFLGYATNVVPFPFSPFSPDGDAARPSGGAKSAAKKPRRTKQRKPEPPPTTDQTDSQADD